MEQEQITLKLTAPTCDVFMTYGMVCCSSSCAAIGLFVKPVCARWKGNLDAFDTTIRCACDRYVLCSFRQNHTDLLLASIEYGRLTEAVCF
jgi:hypothetical protein